MDAVRTRTAKEYLGGIGLALWGKTPKPCISSHSKMPGALMRAAESAAQPT
jgi:hypothetical protein